MVMREDLDGDGNNYLSAYLAISLGDFKISLSNIFVPHC